MTNKGLTVQRELFAQHLARGLEQSEAYRLAFPLSKKWKPESVWSKASVLAAEVKVASRVAELRAKVVRKLELKTEAIQLETARLALVDPKNLWVVDPQTGKRRLKWLDEMDEDTRRCIQSIEMNEDGSVKQYKLWDKNNAGDRAAKLLGAYEKDNRQRTDPLAELLRALTGNVLGVADDPAPGLTDDGEDDAP